VRCKIKRTAAPADHWQMNERPLRTPTATQPALGPRLAGLLLLCVALFALATLVGMFANAAA
jgi:hypothetical protein